jgi:hypothetical protein
MGIFDNYDTEKEVRDKLQSIKQGGEITHDVEWEAEFRIMEINTASENLPGVSHDQPSTSSSQVCILVFVVSFFKQ